LALTLRSFRAGNQWSLQWYQQIAAPSGGTTRDIGAFSIVTTSLRYAALATILAVVLGLLGAMAVQLATRRGVTLEATLLLPLGVSAVTIGFGLLLVSIRGPVDLRGWTFLVPLGQALVAAPLVMMLLLPILRSIDPRLRYVAATLGSPPLKAWWAVDGRLIGRATVGAAGLACAVSLGEFGATAFLARVDEPTIPLQIVRLLGRAGEANFGSATALAVVLLAITAVVLIATERGRTQW
jgi:thiamine transport system permease protein